MSQSISNDNSFLSIKSCIDRQVAEIKQFSVVERECWLSSMNSLLSLVNPYCKPSDLDVRVLVISEGLVSSVPGVWCTCGYRSKDYDLKKGRSGKSAHCSGLAMDIHVSSKQGRLDVVQYLLAAGVKRIGIAPTYIHFDLIENSSVQPPCLWIYDKKNNVL